MAKPPQRQAWSAEHGQALIDAHLHLEGPLLPILNAIQETFGYVPQESVPLIAATLNLSRADVHGVVTFYHDFRAEPSGRHVIRICRAEACQSMGCEAASATLLKALCIDWGETTADGAVTVEQAYCLGLCAVAPGALIDGVPHGRLDAARLAAAAEKLA
jgi:formate dehydrogenase subunit gamma